MEHMTKKSYLELKKKLLELSSNPPLRKVFFTFGRFNPPTVGHFENIDEVFSHDGDHYIFVSKTEDSNKNPLSVETKLEILKAARPDYADFIVSATDDWPSVPQLVNEFLIKRSEYESITMLVGEDRVEDFKQLFNRSRKEWPEIKELNVISSGKRKSTVSATNMREWAKNGEYEKYQNGMGKYGDVPEELIKKSYEEIRNKLIVDETLRERYIKGKVFNIGEIISINESYFEIIDRGSNYLRAVDPSGNVNKFWISDVQPVYERTIKEFFNQKKKSNNQIFYKGYSTANFDKEMNESFSRLQTAKDVYAVLSAIKHTDKFFGTDDLVEQYNHFEKSGHYLNMLEDTKNHSYRDRMELVIAEKILEDISSIKKITNSDKTKTADIILSALGITCKGSPEEKINAAAKDVKKNVSRETKELYGSLFQLADDVGIIWDKSIFTHGQQQDLGILEGHDCHEAFLDSLTENIKYFDDIVCLYEKHELAIVDGDGNENDLPEIDDESIDIETSIAMGLKSSPLDSDSEVIAKQVKVKNYTPNFNLRAKNLALRYLRDRQLRSTLHKMTDQERNQLEKVFTSKGSTITAASRRLQDKLEQLEAEKVVRTTGKKNDNQ